MKRFSKGSKRLLSVLLSGAMLAGTCSSVAVGAADEKEANFARALQYSIYFYDGNFKIGLAFFLLFVATLGVATAIPMMLRLP